MLIKGSRKERDGAGDEVRGMGMEWYFTCRWHSTWLQNIRPLIYWLGKTEKNAEE